MLYAIFPFARKVCPSRFTAEHFTKWFVKIYTHAVQLRTKQNISRDDYLNFLIELKNRKNVPDKVLHAHAYTLFLDGFETTSYILGFALNYLSEHKHCQNKLRAEVNQYKSIGYDELHQMPYLESFLNGKRNICSNYSWLNNNLKTIFPETTRLAPFPFPIWKTCTESIVIEDYDGRPVTIEKGTKILLPINALHSHPDYYSNADQFDPEHFPLHSDSARKLKDAGVFMPFGNGPRSCLGIRYTTSSMKSVLCTLVQNFEMSIDKVDESVSPRNGALFFSGSNTMVKFKKLPRNDE